MAQTKSLPNFTVLGEKVEPKLNLYSSEEGKSIECVYYLGSKKDVMFYAYYGIPDHVDFKGEVSIYSRWKFVLSMQ